MLRPNHSAGFTMIELLISIFIAASLIAMALPSFGLIISNARLRGTTESIQTGLQLARAEAVKRNTAVRFQLTSTATSACALNSSGTNWVISLDNPTGKCDVAPSDTTEPRIIQTQGATQETSGIELRGVVTGTSTGESVAIFNGLGQLTSPAGGISISTSNPLVGQCKSQGGSIRCLRLTVSPSGQVRMCDPHMTGTDPEAC